MKQQQQRHGVLPIVSRILAGTLGAYALTSLATAASSLLLARFIMDRVQAVAAATLCSFLFFAIISMAVFHARSAARSWFWMGMVALPLGIAILAFNAPR